MKKYFITSNKGKFAEISEEIVGLKHLIIDDIPEIQSLDIEEIIRYKLQFANERTQSENTIIIVEDTGLYLGALNSFPGPLIKFLLSTVGNEGIFALCEKLGNYSAKATTVFGAINTNTSEIGYYSASVEGEITAPKGGYGFGWDQIFKPMNSAKTFAEMQTIDEKNRFSMRYAAMLKMKERIIEQK